MRQLGGRARTPGSNRIQPVLVRGARMDLTEELKRKVEGLGQHTRKEGIRAAIRHVEVAERYLMRGRAEEDPDAFNDVIYRTNQAFEGMLKEAYAVLTDKDASKLSPHLIEKHLLDSKKLASRVLTLFTNYRQEWRNPATHDHTLLFTDDEALLAIVSVSAFLVVLLDQVIETASFKRERAQAEQRRGMAATEPTTTSHESFAERVLALLASFGVGEQNTPRTEAEIIGRLSGHIVGSDPSIRVVPDADLGDHHRADLLLERNGQKLVIEVKRARPNQRLLAAATAQVGSYLAAAGAASGIVYVIGRTASDRMRVEERRLDGGHSVWLVVPTEPGDEGARGPLSDAT